MFMSCPEFRDRLVEWARGAPAPPEAAAHVEECTRCARFLDEQRSLSAAMAALAAEPLPPPEHFQSRVMAEVDAALGRHPFTAPAYRWVMAGALAASLLLAAVWALYRAPAPVPAPSTEEAGFIPIPYSTPLSAREQATVWRMRIPVSKLRAVGYQVMIADPNAVVEADVLVSRDGRARAIRPLAVTNSN